MSQFIQIPPEIEHVFGTREGERKYVREGTQAEYRIWTEAVFDVTGGAVSPGGASMFGRISRASVHNRIDDGKLTAFFFVIRKGRVKGLLEPRETPYIYLPIIELKAWASEINERSVRQGKIAPEEIEVPKTGWVQDFLKWKKKLSQAPR